MDASRTRGLRPPIPMTTSPHYYLPRAPTEEEIRKHIQRRGSGAAWMVYHPRASQYQRPIKVFTSGLIALSNGQVDVPFVMSDVGADATRDHAGGRGWWWRPLDNRGNAEPWP